MDFDEDRDMYWGNDKDLDEGNNDDFGGGGWDSRSGYRSIRSSVSGRQSSPLGLVITGAPIRAKTPSQADNTVGFDLVGTSIDDADSAEAGGIGVFAHASTLTLSSGVPSMHSTARLSSHHSARVPSKEATARRGPSARSSGRQRPGTTSDKEQEMRSGELVARSVAVYRRRIAKRLSRQAAEQPQHQVQPFSYLGTKKYVFGYQLSGTSSSMSTINKPTINKPISPLPSTMSSMICCLIF